MITTLSIEERKVKKGARALWEYLLGDSVKMEIFRYNETVIREITYKKRRKNINLSKISAAAGSQRGYIVCGEGIFSDGEAGLYRFYSPRFEERMCTNFALETVSLAENRNLKIGILDNGCVCADIIRDFLKYTDDITVVSSASDEYGYVADEILNDCGASFLLTVDTDALNNCRLLIAPEKIRVPLSLGSRTMVFTVAPPKYPIGGQSYYMYKIILPPQAESVRPRDIDEMYFASALYVKAHCYALGSIVPQFAYNPSFAQTTRSAAKILSDGASASDLT